MFFLVSNRHLEPFGTIKEGSECPKSKLNKIGIVKLPKTSFIICLSCSSFLILECAVNLPKQIPAILLKSTTCDK
jgi:hypothetical protein